MDKSKNTNLCEFNKKTKEKKNDTWYWKNSDFASR